MGLSALGDSPRLAPTRACRGRTAENPLATRGRADRTEENWPRWFLPARGYVNLREVLQSRAQALTRELMWTGPLALCAKKNAAKTSRLVPLVVALPNV